MKKRNIFIFIFVYLVLLILVTFLMIKGFDSAMQLVTGERPFEDIDLGPLAYVGRDNCAECHEDQHNLWVDSHHDLAMQLATDETVLGDFSTTSVTNYGVTSTLYKRDEKFMVTTEGPDGTLNDYVIKYTFGVTPLQQYLVEFPRGRYQTLPLCWDTRPAEEGGQRWFHIYPNEPIRHDDMLHWTGVMQNWNYMCAECHSTDLKKNYDFESDTYNTTYEEINVSCEACHGPGSRHSEWARLVDEGHNPRHDGKKGLVVKFKEDEEITWVIDEETQKPKRSKPLASHQLIEMCARCHSRRSIISEDYKYGGVLMDTHRPALLTEGLYHPDGLIDDEVYVYASFLQSKMYANGVTCVDCHDAHSLKLKYEGNAMCLRCHQHEIYDTTDHHFHKMDDTGASCKECHMPPKNYMVVDPRNDHSFRIPRPDLSLITGSPNACTICHSDQTPEWSAEAFEKWYGKQEDEIPHYGLIIHAAREGMPGSDSALITLAEDTQRPAIVRATAYTMLADYPSQESLNALKGGLIDADPLVRFGAASALDSYPPEEVAEPLQPLLDDPVLTVRVEAAKVLALAANVGAIDVTLPSFKSASEEYIETEYLNADIPQAHINLGIYYLRRGDNERAEASYRDAIRVSPGFIPAWVNLADLYRVQGNDEEGELVLREALEHTTEAESEASVRHALGLLQVRQKNIAASLDELRKAAELAPDNARFSYIYAVALNSVGESDLAAQVLDAAIKRHPWDRDLLQFGVSLHQQLGNMQQAMQYAKKLEMW